MIGRRLIDIPKKLNWRELKLFIRHSPRTSAFVQVAVGDSASWDVTDHLLAGVYDMAAIIAWLNSDTKKNPRPKPLKRPGQRAENEMTFGLGAGVPESEFWKIWDSEPLEIEAGVIDAN